MTPIIIVGAAWGGAILMTLFTVILVGRRGSAEVHDVKAGPPKPNMPQLTPEEIEKLRASTEATFTQAVQDASTTFHADLQSTSQQLNKLITRLTTDVVERELEDYRKSLAAAREDAITSLKHMQTAVAQKQKDLESDMDGELAKRRQLLMERLDTRLGEAVAAYIVESLGQGADLGAQRAFLLASLDRHKADLKREISGE